MSDGDSVFGVVAQRKAHPAIKSGKEDLRDVEGSLGSAKVDGQRLYLGAGGGQAMGATLRGKTNSRSLNRVSPGGFKIRKRK